MPDEQKPAPEAAAPESLSDVMDRARARLDELPPASEPEDTAPAAPAPEADTQAEATPEPPSQGPDDAKIETPAAPVETPTPAPEEAPESKPEGSPAAVPPEPVAAAPEAAESAPDDDDPVIDLGAGKAFHRSDLYDDERFAEFKHELERGYMREDAYTRQRQKDRDEVDTLVQNVTTQMEDRLNLMTEMLSDPDMVRIIAEYGSASDVTRRLIRNPAAARGILRSPGQKEELERVLESERSDPNLRATRETAERVNAENAALVREREAREANAELFDFAGALKQSIDYYAGKFPDADAVEVANDVLALGGLSVDDFSGPPGSLNEAKVAPGLVYLKNLLVTADPATGQRRIRADILEREFERNKLRKTLATTAAPANGKAESHNAAVKAKIEEVDDGPPAVPAGDAPGVGTALPPPKDLSEIRERLEKQAREAHAG